MLRFLRKTLVKNPKKSYYECLICGHFINFEHCSIAAIDEGDDFIYGRAHVECVDFEDEAAKKAEIRMRKAVLVAENFNKNFPSGTTVNLKKDNGSFFKTKTRTPAWVLGSGVAVVSVEGLSGGYLLSRVTPQQHS